MFLKLEIWVSVVCKKYIDMDKEFLDENLLLLLFQLLKFKKLRKSTCKKKKHIRRRPPKFWVQNIFNYNLQQNLRFLQHSSRHYLPRQKQPPEVFCKIKCSSKFHKIHRETPVPVSFLIRFQTSGLQLYLKRDSGAVIFLWILLNF